MNKQIKIFFITIIIQCISITSFAVDYKRYIEELNEQTTCCLDKYVIGKYGFSWKASKEFKWKLCGAKVVDGYGSNNQKYFMSNIPNVDKWGSFYFGLLQNQKTSMLVHAIGWCESGYNPKIISPDLGYGIFQITPAAIGDKNIQKSRLLDPEYNTQYGISHMKKFFKIAQDKYSKYNNNNDPEFDQWMMARGYNGGFKYLDRIFEKSDKPLELIFTGDFIESSKLSGRFICFEKVNVVYPLKVQLTSETLMKKAF